MTARLTLKPYQEEAIGFLLKTPRVALDAGIGSGKTVIALQTIERLWEVLAVRRVLFVAPLAVVLNTLPDEVAKWGLKETMGLTILHGDAKAERLRSPGLLHAINYEGLSWLLGRSDRQHYDMVVFDESHWLKDAQTTRFRLLRRFTQRVPRILMMSGSWIGNSLLDLWAQYFLLDQGERLLRSLEHFRATYFRQTDYHGYKWEPHDWSEIAIVKKVSDITFQVRADDIELTGLTEQVVPVELPVELLAMYQEFERDYLLSFEEGEIEAFNVLSLTAKLRQLANGFVYHGMEENRQVKRFHGVKFDHLEKMMRASNEPVMIVAGFNEDFTELNRRFPQIPCVHGGVPQTRRRTIYQAWNKGELRALAVHPQSSGTGINLQEGGARQIWVSPHWSLLNKNQMVGRLHRTGQKKDVHVDVLVAVGTIDQLIVRAVEQKKFTAENFAATLRAYRKHLKEVA